MSSKLETSLVQLNVNKPPIWRSRGIENLLIMEDIGEGTYGKVYKATDKHTQEIVALKKVKNMESSDLDMAFEEVKLLQMVQHQNVIKLMEVVTCSDGLEKDDAGKAHEMSPRGEANNICMVFEYMDHDIRGLINNSNIQFTAPQIKCYMKQLLTGLQHCHINKVLHRDIKPSNILIDNHGILKLADFGLAGLYDPENTNMSTEVVTLWYRPPEILLESTGYTSAVDMWSVGCVFAELLHGKPILQGETESDQLHKISKLCGSFDETTWPGVSKLPRYKCWDDNSTKSRVKDVFEGFDRHALDLVERMLTLDPAKRITTEDVLHSAYFCTDPLPCSPDSLPKYEPSKTFSSREQRQLKRKISIMKTQQHKSRPPLVSDAVHSGGPASSTGRTSFKRLGPPILQSLQVVQEQLAPLQGPCHTKAPLFRQ